MMKQAQQMQSRMEELQSKLVNVEIIGEAGGGMVRVILNGKGSMLKVSLENSLMSSDEISIIEDLIVAAHNDAKRKVEKYAEEEMKKITGGLSLPAGFQLPF